MSQRAESHDAPLVLEVEGFQHAETGSERVLLRVDGRYGDRPGKRVLDATLFVDDGLLVHRHAPLADAAEDDGDSWLWRAAFDVPTSYLTDERTRFALESQPGCLLDLSRPGEIVRSSAVPLTARAARTARRYAVAIAVLVTVAVTPGGLPASARTEVLRVHNADGSVVYLTRDGQPIAQLPPDAVIIDQGAPAPEPQPEPAPAPQPEAPPAEQPSVPEMADTLRDTGATEKHEPKRDRPAEPARDDKPAPRQTRDDAPAADPAPDPGPAADAPEPKRDPEPKREPADPAPLPEPADEELQAMPLLLVDPDRDQLQQAPILMAEPGSDDAQLQPIAAIGGAEAEAPSSLPTEGLTPMNLLDSRADVTPAASGPAMAAPTHAPPLVPMPGNRDEDAPEAGGGEEQERSGSRRRARRDRDRDERKRDRNGSDHGDTRRDTGGSAPQRAPDGTPTPSNPTFFDALPGAATPGAVPDFVIDKFRVPPFLLPIYQAAGIQYGIRWEVLAAINEIETDYGRNLNVSTAGALGWMQFMPATWRAYGTDANKDGKKDPYNPVDAIFASARYLKAAGYANDVRGAIFAYNHADWYVDSVMLRAKLIAGYPADLVGSLTGLTEGRFPVAARARYANDVQERAVAGEDTTARGIDIFARENAPVVAVNDGVVKRIGRSEENGRYIVIQDVYGNQYTYSNLASVAKLYPVAKHEAKREADSNVETLGANDPRPKVAASAGSQARETAPAPRERRGRRVKRKSAGHAAHGSHGARPPIAAVKQRLFAHPQRPKAERNGGFEQMLARGSHGFETYDSYFSKPLGLNSRNATLRRLKVGSRVVGSTVLGRVGAGPGDKAAHLHFEIRPAGRGAPKIDPKPILDGWKLLESTAIYRAKGKNALYGDGDFSIGEAMLLPKPLLAKRVLSDPRIEIYPAGQQDIRTGQIDRRVLVVLTYLAESGLHPTVSSLRSGHGYLTASGNVSHHSSGNAVDISAINGTPIVGNQGAGSVTEQGVRRLMQLQGTMEPSQIISLLDFGGNTLAMGDHDDHIHVGFTPMFGANRKLGEQAQSVLQPGQWDDLVERLGDIPNPTVPTKPSRYAIPDSGDAGEQ